MYKRRQFKIVFPPLCSIVKNSLIILDWREGKGEESDATSLWATYFYRRIFMFSGDVDFLLFISSESLNTVMDRYQSSFLDCQNIILRRI